MNKIDQTTSFEGQPFAPPEKALLESGENPVHASYWEQQLESELPVFELLPKLHRPASPGNEKKTITAQIPEKLSHWAHDFSRTQSLQPSVIFLTLYKLLLHRYSGLEDIIVGITVDHSPNILPIRTPCEEGITFNEFLQNVQNTVTDALAHAACPFPENIIFPVTYAYQSSSQKPDVAEGGDSEGESDLVLDIVENQRSFILNLIYNPNVYPPEVLYRFADNYVVLLSEISKAPNRLVQAYPIITEQEKHCLLNEFNDTQADYAQDQCIHELFIEKALARPDKTAITVEDKSLSYQQLYERCSDLALFLQSLGVKPDSLVGLCLERSAEMMVALQGILLAGGAYVPMDPAYPDERLSYILQDSQVSIVICQGQWKDKLAPLVGKHTQLIALDESGNAIAARVAELKSQGVSLRREVQPHHLAYVIYTSGSTGKPKGVMIEHRALMNRIAWMQRTYPLQEEDVVLQKTPFSFDVSVWEFVWPLMAGASVVFAKPGGHKEVVYLENLINKCQVTTLHFVPSMLHAYLGHAQYQCSSVRQLFCSGEALDSKSAIEYKHRFPRAKLYNLYGPTEAAIDVTFFDCSQLRTPFVPIGAPISNTQIYVLDRHYHLQPLGVAGELYIAGEGLARGYLRRPDLTRERFVANPFNPGLRMYKSGDLARWREDGTLEYLGRMDTQVKIRGFRIETGEIETRLDQHPEINSSGVVVKGKNARKKLIAFYLAKGTKAGSIIKLPTEDLRSHLLQTLPDYMLPAAFVSLEEFPVTSNGKLNRCALESMDVYVESSQTYSVPRDATEQQLVRIWAEVLNIPPERIGIHDNFIELGGHSLLVAQLIAKIRNQLAVELPPNAFFNLSTIAGITEVIEAVNYQGEDEFGDIEFEEITL